MRNTYITDGVAISATSYNQALRSKAAMEKADKANHGPVIQKARRTQYHAK